MNSPATAAIFLVLILALILFTVIKNQKEKKRLERKIKEDDKNLKHSRRTDINDDLQP